MTKIIIYASQELFIPAFEMINKAQTKLNIKIKKVYIMKKLGKLSINPEKVIKNEALVNLRGGYGDANGVFCGDSDGNGDTYCIAPWADPHEICGDTYYVISFTSSDCG